MGKKTKKQYSKIAEQVQYYKWEFLRRNSKYEKDLDAFNKKGCFFEICETKNKALRDRKLKVFNKANRDFAKRWGLYYLPNPDYPSPDEDLETIKLFGHKEIMFPYATRPNFHEIDLGAEWGFKNKPNNLNQIKIEINLSRPKENILYEVGRIVDALKKVRKHKGMELKGRNRFFDYEGYLQVYDLKNQDWSWERIVKKFYKIHIGHREYKYLTREIKRDYEKCKELIDGGYKKIR